MGLNKSFWKNKRVVLTGHSGFKGTWISLLLSYLGSKVYGFSLEPNTNPSMFDIVGSDHLEKSSFFDINNLKDCCDFVSEIKPDIIIHMAAQPLVRDSFINPIYTLQTNIIGTANILEAARKVKNLKSIIVVTSDKCYENLEINYAYKENDRLGGLDPYSSSKGCAEIVASSFYRSFFKKDKIGLATVRAGNVIGGGDWSKNRLIPDIIKSIVNKHDLEIRNLLAIRPWQFVLEPLVGYLKLCEKNWENFIDYSGAWNFGPKLGTRVQVGDVIKKVSDFWGSEVKLKSNKNLDFHEANLLELDITKAATKLNWKPILSVNDSICKTVDWYKENQNANNDMLIFSLNQIKDYLKKI